MIKMVAEQENGRNYLKCILEQTSVIDEDCLATISDEKASEGNQIITGIIPVIYSQVFNERILRYDVNAFMPLQEYKGYISSKQQIFKLFLSIIDICRQADAFLLDMAYFLLEEEYIYVDKETGKAHLILYPILGQTGQGDFRKLFLQMMQGIHLSMEDMNFYGSVLYELNQADSFSIVKFRELLVGASNNHNVQEKPHQEKVQQIKEIEHGRDTVRQNEEIPKKLKEIEMNSPVVQKSMEKEGNAAEKKKGLFDKVFAGKALKDPMPEKRKTGKEKQKQKKVSACSFLELPDEEVKADAGKSQPQKAEVQSGTASQPMKQKERPAQISGVVQRAGIPMTDDEDIMEYGSTADEMEGTPYVVLHYLNENKYITVSTFPFEIGREGKGFRIDASKTKVSRKHAEIILAPDGFKVCDLSKLGTFLDGVRIPQGSYVPLVNGAKLSLKDEEFIVNIYEG